MRTPRGITPPSPGLDREEPELRREEDIPADDAAKARRGAEDRPRGHVERGPRPGSERE